MTLNQDVWLWASGNCDLIEWEIDSGKWVQGSPLRFTPIKETAYDVHVIGSTIEGCEIEVLFQNKLVVESSLFIPNSFSPNYDGLNDVFRVLGGTHLKSTMTIYNQWGESVFSINDANQGWNGMYKGEVSQAGTYTYLIRLQNLEDEKILTGHINLTK